MGMNADGVSILSGYATYLHFLRVLHTVEWFYIEPWGCVLGQSKLFTTENGSI